MAVRRRKISSLVREILRQAGIRSIPIPVEKIVQQRGIDLRLNNDPQSDVSGFLFLGGERPMIGVNSSQAQVRQRFTIAHELGHYLLHGFPPSEVHVDHGFKVMLRDGRSSEGTDEAEREANLFAAELLMPEDLLRAELRDTQHLRIDDAEVAVDELLVRLAGKYGVSKQVMMFRLANLGYLGF